LAIGDLLVTWAEMLLLAGFALVWTFLIARWRQGEPIISFEPRRPVPWKGWDVLLVMLIYFIAAPLLALAVARSVVDIQPPAPLPAAAKAAEPTTLPPAVVVLGSHDPWAILVCAVTVVVLAPLTEELLFRLLLLGWLEAVERRVRRQLRTLRQITAGAAPIVTASLLFAVLHFRRAEPADFRTIMLALIVQAAVNLATIGAMVAWLKLGVGATMADFGIDLRKWKSDVKLGLLGFLAVTPPVYVVLAALQHIVPKDIVADPVPIFLLALVLGTLYYRTHRIVASIVLHTAFNAVGVLLALAAR
jgi:membrane protease YdiL (CAAX protease family)